MKHNYKEKNDSNCVKIPILDIILFPLKHTYRSVLVSSSSLIAIIILCMIKDHSYLSNIKHSVSLYGEQIIIVFVVLVIVARWEGDWRKLPWTGMSLQIGNLVKMYFLTDLSLFFVAFTNQFLFPVPLIHFPNGCRSWGSDDSLVIGGDNIQMAKALTNI